MTLALADFLIEKCEAPEFLKFDHIADMEKRFRALMDTIFRLNGPGPSIPVFIFVFIT
jgi:hypothetical protein